MISSDSGKASSASGHLGRFRQRVLQCRVVRSLNLQAARRAPATRMKQSARRRARGAAAVGVIDAAVTRTHEQARLRKPGDRAAQVAQLIAKHQELVVRPSRPVPSRPAHRRRCAPTTPSQGCRSGLSNVTSAFRRAETLDRPSDPIDRCACGAEEIADYRTGTPATRPGLRPVEPTKERAPRRRATVRRGGEAWRGLRSTAITESYQLRVASTVANPSRADAISRRLVRQRRSSATRSLISVGGQRAEVVVPAVGPGEVWHPQVGPAR